ncbi:MAG: hypothetical protein IJM71_05585 [Clostridia bacterium]|nr:hypothetical protein [Clostridia bacterium]
MKKKSLLIVLIIAAVLLSVAIVLFVVNSLGKSGSNSSDDNNEGTASYSNREPEIIDVGSDIRDDNTINVFKIVTDRTDEAKATVTVSIGGDVIVSNYKLGIKFDSQVLKLVNYDSEIGIFSSIVNPEIIDGVVKWQNGVNDVVELTWAAANNYSKPGDIILLEFEILDETVESLPVVLSVEEIGCLNDSDTVEKPAYSIDDSGM